MNEATEVKPVISSALARPIGSAEWTPIEWTQERKDLARKQIAPLATEPEFLFFLEWSAQTGLNPFLKQCFLIERWDSASNVKRFEPMVAEAGFAARADALPDFGGMRSGVVYAGDIFGIDEVSQTIVHEWDLQTRAKNQNKVLGAWAHAVRAGRVIEISWVTVESRAQYAGKGADRRLTQFWARDMAGQIRKCARADQYRRAYPNIFAGWYSDAENRDEEREVNAPPVAPATPTGKSEALKERLKKQAKTVDAQPANSSKPPDAKASPPGKKTSSAPAIDEVRFGAVKGRKIIDCSTIELEEALKVAHEQLSKATGKESWFANVKEGVDAIDAELQQRDGASESAEDGSAPEPGSGG